MKLFYNKKSNNPTYFIQQGIRNGKKTTTRNVFRIGKHNDLLKITDDPLAYAKQKVIEYNEEYQNNKVTLDVIIDFNKKLTSSNSTVPTPKHFNIGYFYLQSIYHDLKLHNFFKDITKNYQFKFDATLINRFLTFSRILDPSSKLGIYDHLNIYYEKPEYTYEASLHFLSLLVENFDEYIAHLFKESNNVHKRNTSVCYFDCTNYYFEIENPDDDYVDAITGEVMTGLRQYGMSKQHQPAPLVQMGLFMDGDGIPLNMCISNGNQNEQLSATPTKEKLLKMFENQQLIYCADAGLGSYDIRKFNSFGNLSYIVTQSIKKLKGTLKEAVFNDNDYRLLSTDENITIKELQEFDRNDKKNLALYNDKAYKVLTVNNLANVGLSELVQINPSNVKQYVVIVYSRKLMEYQRFIRNIQKENTNNYLVDEEKYDGFYAIVTNLNAIKNVKEIIKVNSQRYEIEEYFKSTSLNHQSNDEIIAHYMTCYTALLVYRLLEAKLKDTNVHYTKDELIETLNAMNIANCHDLYYQATYTSGELCDALNSIFKLDLNKEYYQPKVLNKTLKSILK